jgi:hypothetical protein|tara:strand:+ start:329 stop:511 length:183 start_codon:yes stop_codon:yes gene_type:complete
MKKNSPIDSMIIDLILEHYNIQVLKGKKETLSGEQFMQIVELAEQQYYEQVLTDSKVGMA